MNGNKPNYEHPKFGNITVKILRVFQLKSKIPILSTIPNWESVDISILIRLIGRNENYCLFTLVTQ
jgi:hypothetical protein